MVTQRKPRATKYLTAPTRPVQVDRDRSVAGLLEKMEGTGLGARQLAEAHRIWLDMLGDNTTVVVAASGALIPAGMRRLLAYVIKNRFVDVLVCSGAMLFHDLHETLGRHHFQAHPSMTDAELEASQISRMWDVLASEEEYREADEWVGGFTNQLDQTRAYSTREFLHLLGRELAEIATDDGILTSAYKARIPIFCPTISDSSITVGIAGARFEKKNSFCFDLAQDMLDLMQIARALARDGRHQPRRRNQPQLTSSRWSRPPRSSRRPRAATSTRFRFRPTRRAPAAAPAPTPTTSRSSSASSQRGAATAYVSCDATIALPILVTALSQTAAKYMKGRKRPNFIFMGRELTVEVP